MREIQFIVRNDQTVREYKMKRDRIYCRTWIESVLPQSNGILVMLVIAVTVAPFTRLAASGKYPQPDRADPSDAFRKRTKCFSNVRDSDGQQYNNDDNTVFSSPPFKPLHTRRRGIQFVKNDINILPPKSKTRNSLIRLFVEWSNVLCRPENSNNLC